MGPICVFLSDRAVLGWWVGEQVDDHSGRRHILGGERVNS